jgi:DNA replication and repair protein RecF
MRKRQRELASAEQHSGFSLVGAHKHDLRLLYNQNDSRFFCSQGQQRLVILALKLAQIKLHYDVLGYYPILLLDDVLSEIDEAKRLKLVEYLEMVKAQIFMTTTEESVLKHLNKELLTLYKVDQGMIEKMQSAVPEVVVPSK